MQYYWQSWVWYLQQAITLMNHALHDNNLVPAKQVIPVPIRSHRHPRRR
jgi:hypothetical protein